MGIEPTTFGILGVAQLAEHWASIPKVVGSIPTVVRHIFQACPVWIYTQSNITSIIDNQLKYLIYCMRNRTRCEKIKGEVSVAIEVVIRFDRHQL